MILGKLTNIIFSDFFGFLALIQKIRTIRNRRCRCGWRYFLTQRLRHLISSFWREKTIYPRLFRLRHLAVKVSIVSNKASCIDTIKSYWASMANKHNVFSAGLSKCDMRYIGRPSSKSQKIVHSTRCRFLPLNTTASALSTLFVTFTYIPPQH